MHSVISSVTNYFKEIIKPLGLVFGDIGTSPIYTLSIVLMLVKPTQDNIIGVVSLIIWTLIVLVFFEYAWLAMSLGERGEGGTIVLREILLGYVKNNKTKIVLAFITFLGVSLLIGDGVITPAISILSAVEGLVLIPACKNLTSTVLIIIAGLIALALFSVQRKGTDKVANFFGPFTFAWILSLAVTGIISIFSHPEILYALNPYYGIKFLIGQGFLGFAILSSAFLCATGGEALYADMGQIGREPIIKAWYFVFVALVCNYLGQGAFLISHTKSVVKAALFEMVYNLNSFLYFPFLILSIIATVIASQALISGIFSVVYQGITTRIMPMLKLEFTSPNLRSQLYIGIVNWFLFVCIIIVMCVFKESNNLGAAYGLAVSGTMAITGVMISIIFFYKKKWLEMSVGILVMIIDFIYLFSNTLKLPHGGYWSLIIALFPLTFIIIYYIGNRQIYKFLRPIRLVEFLEKYKEHYFNRSKIEGTALFFARDVNFIPPYINLTMFINDIVYTENIIISVDIIDEPFGVSYGFKNDLCEGLRVFEIKAGYMEIVDIESIIKQAEINEKVIFYGVEEIITDNFLYQAYATIKKVTPSFVQFYKLPSDKVHGVTTRIHMN